LTTWWQANEEIAVEDAKFGRLQLRVWHSLHLRQAAMHPVSLSQLQRLDTSSHSTPKPLCLIWIGLESASLNTIWQQYLRRLAIDHWYRFAKQRLHWTSAPAGNAQTIRTMERLLDAPAHLAALVSSTRSARLSAALAKIRL
jgi:hypothetical protein